MSTGKRNNGPARWAVLMAGGIAAAGFWLGVVSGPPPAHSDPPTP